MSPELPQEPRARSRWKMPLAAVVFIGATTFIGFTGIECREQTLASLRIKSAERSVPTVAAATSAALGVLTPMPCVPAVVAPWVPGAPRTLIGGKPALTSGSTCTCAYGGVISLTFPGAVRTTAQ